MQDTLAPKKPHVHRSWHFHASAVTASAVGGLLFADPGSRVRGRGSRVRVGGLFTREMECGPTCRTQCYDVGCRRFPEHE